MATQENTENQPADKRRSMVVGVCLLNEVPPPRWCLGNYYSRLTPAAVSSIQALFDEPTVKETFDAFLEAFGEVASDMGVEVALVKGAPPQEIEAIKAFKSGGRKRRRGGKG